MRKGLLVLCSLILIITVTGCVRAYKFTKERVDADVSGNQGVIYGPTPAPHKVQSPSREMYGLDIELPMTDEVKSSIKKKGETPEQPAQVQGIEASAGPVSQEKEKIK